MRANELIPTFAWKRPRGRRFRLLVFLAAALALHVLLFYLFQVVYPPSRRLVRQPVGITLLTPATPGALSILQDVADRSPTFEGGIREGVGILGRENEFVADYIASYQGYQPALVEQEFETASKPLPLLAAPGSVVLPRLDRPEPPAPATSPQPWAPALPRWQVSGALASRGVLRPASLEGIDLTALATLPQAPRLRIGVDPSGAIEFCGMVSLLPAELEGQVRRAARTMRFVGLAAENSGETPEFGWLTLDWRVAGEAPPNPTGEAEPE